MSTSMPGQQDHSSNTPRPNLPMLAALAVLVVAIVMTVGTLAWQATGFDRTTISAGTVDPTIGYAFYDALDQVLAGQGTDALEQVVAGGFLDHSTDAPEGRSRDQMIEQLTTFAAAFPRARMKVVDIQAAPGALIATLATMELSGKLADGLSVTTGPAAGGYELLRVRNGAIVERWGAGMPQLQISTAPDADFEIGATSSDALRLDAVELPADGTVRWKSGEVCSVLVQSGTVQVTSQWVGSEGEDMRTSKVLSAGQAISLEPGSLVTVRTKSDDSSIATFLLMSVASVRPVDVPRPDLGPGASLALLWSSNLPAVPRGSWQFSAGQLTVPVGMSVQLQGDHSSKLLLASGTGSGRVSALNASISTLDQGYLPADAGSTVSLATGNAALVDDASLVELESTAAEPVTFWVISVRLDSPTAEPAATPTAATG